MRFKLLCAVTLIVVLAFLALREFGQNRAQHGRADESHGPRRTIPPEEPRIRPESAPETPPEGLLRVRVVGPTDRPLEGVILKNRAGQTARTGPDGWTSLEPGDPPQEVQDSLIARWHPLPTPETVIRIEELLPLRVAYVDAVTGLPLEGGPPLLQTAFGGTQAPDEGGALWVPAAAGPQKRTWRILLDPPPGLTGGRGIADWVRAQVSVRADRLFWPVPLLAQQALQVHVTDAAGDPIADATLRVKVGSEWIVIGNDRTDESGTARIRGVPYRPDRKLLVRAQRPPLAGSVVEHMPSEPGLLSLKIQVDPGELEEIENHSEVDFDVAFVEPPPPETHLEVIVHRQSRLPFSDGWVMVGEFLQRYEQLDAEGRVTLRGLPPDRYWVSPFDPAIPPDPVLVDLVEARPELVELTATSGWTAEVRAEDENRRPLAAVEVRAWVTNRRGARIWEHALVRDGQQWLRQLTGPDGRAELPNLPNDYVEVFAWDSRYRKLKKRVHPKLHSTAPIVLTLP